MSYICIRYGDLNDMDDDLMKNYLLPSNHPIIPIAQKLEGISGGGYICQDEEDFLHGFFKDQENGIYRSTRKLYDLCRDPNVTNLIEIYYYC